MNKEKENGDRERRERRKDRESRNEVKLRVGQVVFAMP